MNKKNLAWPLHPLHNKAAAPAHQRGMTLIVVMLMLSAVFVVVALSARLALLAERSARNDRDRQVALQAAEAALGDAETDIMGPSTATNRRDCPMYGSDTAAALPVMFETGCGSTLVSTAGPPYSTLGLCAQNTGTQPLYKTVFSVDPSSAGRAYVQYGEITGKSAQLLTGTSGGLPALPPRYIVELIPYNPIASQSEGSGKTGSQFQAFQITALGFGLNPSTQVMLQAIISKPGITPGC